MKLTVKLVAKVIPGTPIEHEIATFERPDLSSPASIGLTIDEGKFILASLQREVIAAQIQQHGASIQSCCRCGKALRTKGYYKPTLRSVYGNVGVRVRRVMGCSCSGSQARSFSTLFTRKNPVTPELRYLTAKMAALLPFGKVADFLGELLPLSAKATASTVRNRTMKVGKRFTSLPRSWLLPCRKSPVRNWSWAWMAGMSETGTSDRSATSKSWRVRRWIARGTPLDSLLCGMEV